MLQASIFDCGSFDPFSFQQDGRGCQIEWGNAHKEGNDRDYTDVERAFGLPGGRTAAALGHGEGLEATRQESGSRSRGWMLVVSFLVNTWNAVHFSSIMLLVLTTRTHPCLCRKRSRAIQRKSVSDY